MRSWLTKWLGSVGERAAARFLRKQGYRILARNHRNWAGEIDLIALDGDTIVFVEVKSRSGLTAGEAWEAVDAAKQAKLSTVATVYLKQRGWLERRARFDVIDIRWSKTETEPVIRHFRHAFEASCHY